ncbi:branched-chain amino acid ABC transporter permease [Porcincola intestinalis]|uniref:branched-chain amino acid ABC transporter permease n=1 Tax=Porcincola intestinalis TaxID=2606632 RepID=UPI0023EF6EAF|nr:branched-chain amino acid ABC transporter permease [Porcincola intestinalis]MCI6699726.1 branched-chain amino acid ABC transporter permease [Lachnospiraceae bacterium]MDD7059831.1 branched-chain amino acid ABC transporter permease [Porcincola intestinalis]MDY5283075.1 branched-chain amino acid ABC transporter permease [Porcincola intestinalis]
MAKQKKLSKAARTYLTSLILVGAFWGAIEAVKFSGGLTSKAAGLLIPVCAYIMMAISLNLVVGFLGELSLGHAAFMSAGAFAGVFFYNTAGAGMPEWAAIVLAFLIGGLAAGIFGVIVGVPVLRLSGDYLAIVTLAFGEILKNVLNSLYIGADSAGLHFSLKDQFSLNMEPTGKVLMKGAMGITGIRKFSVFSVGILLIALTLLFVLNLMNSRGGRAITAIRDDDIAARSIGINLTKYKLMAFVSSAVIAGFAGVLYGLNFASLVAKKFDYNLSINILVMVVLGGMGSIPGAIIAAVVLTVLPELLRGFSQYRMFIYSIVLIVMMLFNRAPAFVMWRQRLALKLRSGKAGPGTGDAGKKKG